MEPGGERAPAGDDEGGEGELAGKRRKGFGRGGAPVHERPECVSDFEPQARKPVGGEGGPDYERRRGRGAVPRDVNPEDDGGNRGGGFGGELLRAHGQAPVLKKAEELGAGG